MNFFQTIIKTQPYFLATLLLAACTNKKTTGKAEPESGLIQLSDTQIRHAGITFGKADKRTMQKTLRLQGRVDVPPQNLVSVSFPLGGYLKHTDMLPGTRVVKGQVIAIMQDMQYVQIQQDYLTARAKLEYAEADYARQKELYDGQAGSKKALELARSEAATWRATTASLSEKLRLLGLNPANLSEASITGNIRVLSPINGYVASVSANVGKYLDARDVIMELVDPADIHLNLKVFEKDLGSLAIGQKISCWTNPEPDRKYRAEIILIGRNFSEDRSVEVHGHFADASAHLTPGQFMNAEVTLTDTAALTLPEDAVVRWQNAHYVFVRRGKLQVEMLPVSRVATHNGRVQVTFSDPVPADAEFVLTGAYTLLMLGKNGGEE